MTTETTPFVAQTASIPDALPLHEVSLLGLFGGPEDQSALLRNPAGDVAMVKTGDRVFGLTVIAMNDASVQFRDERGRDGTLSIPH